jgi:hypothetical protein
VPRIGMGDRMTTEGKTASTNSENDREQTWAKLDAPKRRVFVRGYAGGIEPE